MNRLAHFSRRPEDSSEIRLSNTAGRGHLTPVGAVTAYESDMFERVIPSAQGAAEGVATFLRYAFASRTLVSRRASSARSAAWSGPRDSDVTAVMTFCPARNTARPWGVNA